MVDSPFNDCEVINLEDFTAMNHPEVFWVYREEHEKLSWYTIDFHWMDVCLWRESLLKNWKNTVYYSNDWIWIFFRKNKIWIGYKLLMKDNSELPKLFKVIESVCREKWIYWLCNFKKHNIKNLNDILQLLVATEIANKSSNIKEGLNKAILIS